MTSEKKGVYLVSAKRKEPYVVYDNDGDTQLNIETKSEPNGVYENEEESPFYGMGKEELLELSSGPHWRRFRAVCIGFVLLAWLALLVTVVALVLLYPKCKPAEERTWWQKDVIYRIYVRSFKDSNGDGIGDLQGIEEKLDYIQSLGANTISLSPVFDTDNSGSDFAVVDSYRVHPDFGTEANLTSLIAKVKDKGMRILLDFIPNQTSRNHSWFTNSLAATMYNDTYRNYYVWVNDNEASNWLTIEGESAWTSGTVRNQSYLGQFGQSEPDLNLRSGRVQQELKSILEFWVNKGIDGFYVRNSAYLLEDYDMRNEMSNGGSSANEYENLDHMYTLNQPGVLDMLSRWRSVVQNGSARILIADTPDDDIEIAMSYYGYWGIGGAHLALNRFFFEKAGSCDGACVKEYVNAWLPSLTQSRWANWMAGDENVNRVASRFNASYVRAYYMLTMLLPGTPILYYGDEIMLKNNPDLTQTSGRAQAMRGLMQWQNSTYGGFCVETATPWIRANPDYMTNNVQSQHDNEDSMLNFIRTLTDFRKQVSFETGSYYRVVVDDQIFSFVREFNGEKGYLVAINFGLTSQTRSYYSGSNSIEKDAEVALTSGPDVNMAVEDEVSTDSITLGPLQGVVVSWDYVAKEEL